MDTHHMHTRLRLSICISKMDGTHARVWLLGMRRIATSGRVFSSGGVSRLESLGAIPAHGERRRRQRQTNSSLLIGRPLGADEDEDLSFVSERSSTSSRALLSVLSHLTGLLFLPALP